MSRRHQHLRGPFNPPPCECTDCRRPIDVDGDMQQWSTLWYCVDCDPDDGVDLIDSLHHVIR